MNRFLRNSKHFSARWVGVFPARHQPINLNAAFSTVPSQQTNATRTSTSPTSLYNLSEPLYKPEDFITLTKQAIQRINSIRSFLKEYVEKEQEQHKNADPALQQQTTTRLSATSKLQLLDAVSNELCCIMDAAELCRNSHANLEFQQAAEQSFALLSDFIIELNADHFLYEEILLPIIQNPNEWSSLTTEEQYFATDLRRDFENEGIHLKGSALQQLKQLQQQVVMAETTWSQNLVNRELQRVIAIGPFPAVSGQTPDHFQTLSNWMQQFSIPKPAKQPQRQQGQHGRYLYSTLDRRILQPLMNSIPDEKLRKSLFLESSVQPSANIAALQKLLLTRQSLAHTLQHASYGHRAIMKHVHQSPVYLHDMFKHIAKAVHPVVTRELQSLEEVKRRFEQHHHQEEATGSSGSASSASSSFSSSLSPWNLGYYQNIAKQEKALLSHSQSSSSSSSSSSSARQRISSYFPLDACVDGLRLVSERLFGLSMREVEVEKDYEHWGHSRGEHDQEIRKFEIYDIRRGLGSNGKEKGELLGICYFDLFHREHKFPGSAHFTIRCGCERVLDFPSLATSTASSAGGFAKLRTDRQTPIVALVFHFQPPHQSHSRTQGFGSSLLNKAGKFFSGGLGAGAGKGNQPLLSLHDIETLFHEWGHALHSLLSQTKFQHLSGTRGGTDFIEIPSHLMEHFARDPNVIRQWARHHLTNEKIPEGLLEDAFDHKTDFAAIELQHQVLLSGADQFIFGPEMRDITFQAKNDQDLFIRVLDGVAKVQQDLTMLPVASTLALQEVTQDYEESTKMSNLKKEICRQISALPSMNILNHGHFINYGGSYYSYLFAKMYAAQIWHQNLVHDPLNPDAGELIRREMLSYGSSRSPKDIFAAITKGDLDPNYYLKQLM